MWLHSHTVYKISQSVIKVTSILKLWHIIPCCTIGSYNRVVTRSIWMLPPYLHFEKKKKKMNANYCTNEQIVSKCFIRKINAVLP